MNFSVERKRMVEEQLIARGITSERVLNAFYRVERHNFIPAEKRSDAYQDRPAAIGEGQTISQPYIVALMTESLELTGKETVLEIGTGSGYQTAILAELAREVFTVERFAGLANRARETLEKSGYINIRCLIGDGTLGWPEHAPFDRIMVTAYCRQVPGPLIEQLRDPGKLVIPLGDAFGQNLTLAEKENKTITCQTLCPCVFVPLVGEYGVQTL